jgi:DNA primase
MASFDYGIVSKIQQANDIVDLISEYISLKKKGREMVGLCPFHQDHKPSLYVNPTKQIFKCFACGAGGDSIRFVQMQENLTFPQALQRLADRAGIKIPTRNNISRQTPAENIDIDPNTLVKVNAWVSQHFQANLYNPKRKMRDYLTKRKLIPQTKMAAYLAAAGSELAASLKRFPSVAYKVWFIVKSG